MYILQVYKNKNGEWGIVNQGRKKDGESTFTAAVKLPVVNAWIGISASTILTRSRVTVVLALLAIAAAPTCPPKILY